MTLRENETITSTFYDSLMTGNLLVKKYEDIDGDGGQDAGEPFLNGWAIFIDLNGNGSWDDATGDDPAEPKVSTSGVDGGNGPR